MSARRSPRLLTATKSVALLAALALGVAACGSGGTDGAATGQAGGKIKIAASTNVWGSVVAAVGGDKVEVTSIINKPDADPHSYETTPQDALAVQDAKLLLSNGGGYDDFFAKLSDQAKDARKLIAYDIGKTGDENEHVWYSLPTVDKVADQVASQLGELDAGSKQVFADNAKAFKAKVDDVEKKAEQVGTAHPGSQVIATEPVAHYLLDAAKVTDATPKEFSEAIEQETDVPAATIEQVKQLVSGKKVKAVVNNAQTTTPVTEQVIGAAKAAGVPVVDVTETLPAGVTDYIAWMTSELDKLAGALSS